MNKQSTIFRSRHCKLITALMLSLMLIFSVSAMTSCEEQKEDDTSIFDSFLKCNDKNNDHLCDICAGVMSECIDEDLNHICDICEKETVTCPIDTDWDHLCDVCGARVNDCFDNDNNHICDYCAVVVLGCKDENKDHFCDICKLKRTDCADLDKNHLCDICGKRLSKCEEGNTPDHICEYCGEDFSKCSDSNKDHYCDVCLVNLSLCGDEDKDHKCDVCSKILSHCIDESGNFLCDICGSILPWISIKMADDCLVNGEKEEAIYSINDSYLVVFTYVGDNKNGITGWIIYDNNGSQVAEIIGEFTYRFNKGGYYFVAPIFAEE